MTINITSGPSNGSIQYNGVDKIIVDSGNVSVTGNSIVSGNLTVTGAGAFGSNLTVGGSNVMTTALAVPEIISTHTPDTGTITRYHNGPVLIQFSGYCYSGSLANLSWAFYVNGSAVLSRSNVVNFQVAVNPQFMYTFTSVGNFTARINLYGDSGQYDSQIIIWYL